MLNPFDLFAALFPQALFLVAFAPVIFYGWRLFRAFMMGPRIELHSVALERERELRLAQMRARRLRTARYQDEHSSWDEEFRALGGGCACHGGPRRPRLRESPPVARW